MQQSWAPKYTELVELVIYTNKRLWMFAGPLPACALWKQFGSLMPFSMHTLLYDGHDQALYASLLKKLMNHFVAQWGWLLQQWSNITGFMQSAVSTSSQEPEYRVFTSCLWQLFSKCPMHASPCAVNEKCKGSLLVVDQKCSNSRCQQTRRWQSQPFVANSPAWKM